MTDIQKEISRAKINMLQNPNMNFIANVACSLETIVDNDIPTACTDGKTIRINESFFMNLLEAHRSFLIAHEVLHVVFMHLTRREQREPFLWNLAGDYVINLELSNMGFKIPQMALFDYKYKGMSTEEVYDLLNQDKVEIPTDMMIDLDYQEQDPTQTKQTEDYIKSIIIRASQQASMKSYGKSIPQSIQRYLNQLLTPKVDWKVVLKRFALDLAKTDLTWRKPNKRYLSHGFYLPSLQGNTVSKLTFAIDTSGSINEKEFNQFLSEVYTVINIIKPKEIELIQFDHQIQGIDIVKTIQDLKRINLKGHGGTDPNVVLERQSNSKAIIVLTDGHFSTNLTNPNKPVIWVVYNNLNFTAPFGKTIHTKL